MGSAARKARKRAGEQFVHPEKEGTRPAERAGVLVDHRGRDRSEKQIEERLAKLGTSAAEELYRRGRWPSQDMKIPRRVL